MNGMSNKQLLKPENSTFVENWKIDNCIEETDKRRSTITAILKRRLILRKVNTKKERRFCKVLVTEEGKLVEFRNVEFL